jgi:nicotinate-nucleotide pyrophosphorylase (carboxylating)
MNKFNDYINWFIENSLNEDVGSGDHTSNACIPEKSVSKAILLVKDNGVIAGVEMAERIFKYVARDIEFERIKNDGDVVHYGDIVFKVNGGTRSILKAERLVLNVMQRLSGIATASSEFAMEVSDLPVKILDTRKTTPLLRPLEKWAVKLGGCHNYREGLYDWIMIKDNHIDAAGGIKKTIKKVNKYLADNKLDLGITIEVRNLVELHKVLDTGGVTRIMLDNFEPALLREAVLTVNGRFETEVSGGITLHNLREIAETGVDCISTGAITHSAGILDLSLKILSGDLFE